MWTSLVILLNDRRALHLSLWTVTELYLVGPRTFMFWVWFFLTVVYMLLYLKGSNQVCLEVTSVPTQNFLSCHVYSLTVLNWKEDSCYLADKTIKWFPVTIQYYQWVLVSDTTLTQNYFYSAIRLKQSFTIWDYCTKRPKEGLCFCLNRWLGEKAFSEPYWCTEHFHAHMSLPWH